MFNWPVLIFEKSTMLMKKSIKDPRTNTAENILG